MLKAGRGARSSHAAMAGSSGAASASRTRINDLIGGVVLRAIEVVRDVLTDSAKGAIKEKAAAVAARYLAKRVDDQVTEGVYLAST